MPRAPYNHAEARKIYSDLLAQRQKGLLAVIAEKVDALTKLVCKRVDAEIKMEAVSGKPLSVAVPDNDEAVAKAVVDRLSSKEINCPASFQWGHSLMCDCASDKGCVLWIRVEKFWVTAE